MSYERWLKQYLTTLSFPNTTWKHCVFHALTVQLKPFKVLGKVNQPLQEWVWYWHVLYFCTYNALLRLPCVAQEKKLCLCCSYTEDENVWNSKDGTIHPCWIWQGVIFSDENLRNLGSVPQELTHMLIFMHNSCMQIVTFGLCPVCFSAKFCNVKTWVQACHSWSQWHLPLTGP